jgi:hypothetical protein
MAPLVLAGFAAFSCAQPHFGLTDAKRLVLAAVTLTPAARAHGSMARVALTRTLATGWQLRAYATHACAPTPGPCSNLLGHYFVSRAKLGLIDEDAGFDGVAVDSAATIFLRNQTAAARCGS